MGTTFEERIQKAAIFLQEEKLQDSIHEYSEALKYSQNHDQQIDLYNVLGRLYQKTKMPKKAIAAFQESLKLYEVAAKKDHSADIASVHNNLAAALLPTDVSSAITHYKRALSFYEKLDETAAASYSSHLANTHYALAEAFVQKENPLYAKKHFKEALKGYESHPELAALKARVHYQLGIIYTDEFNLFDAKTQYSKALALYESQMTEGNNPNMAIMAALYNNLAVTHNSMEEHPKAIDSYERSLALYQKLATTHPDVFLPNVTATLNSLAILYANTHELSKAIDHMQQTIDAYHALSDEHPDQYTHYLATALHNQGLFYFEDHTLDKAEHFFTEALSLRRKMAMSEPEAFGPDVCATALNMVELYQINLENKLDISLKSKSLELLQEVERRLDSFKDDRLVIKNMRIDCAAHLEYFNSISLEALSLQYVNYKASEFREEMNSTILPSEKLTFQKELTKLLEEKHHQFPQNIDFKSQLAMAYNDLAWLLLRLGQPKKARASIVKGLSLDNNSPILKCNLAHTYLLENNTEKAMQLYLELVEANKTSEDNFKEIITKDMDILMGDGANKIPLEAVLKKLTI